MCWLNRHPPIGPVWILGLTSNDIIDDIHTILKWYHRPQARQQNSGRSTKSLAHTNKETNKQLVDDQFINTILLQVPHTQDSRKIIHENPIQKLIVSRKNHPSAQLLKQNSTFYLIMLHMTPFHQLIAKKTPWFHGGKVTSREFKVTGDDMARWIQMIPDIFWGPRDCWNPKTKLYNLHHQISICLVGGGNRTPLKNISQNGNLPQVGVNIKNLWNQLVYVSSSARVQSFVFVLHWNCQGTCRQSGVKDQDTSSR